MIARSDSRRGRDKDPSAYRPQPARGGPDFWPTPKCLTAALLQYVLPALPGQVIWECAAGDGKLAGAIAATGRKVIASDLVPISGGAAHDFLHADMPVAAVGAAVVTNPPGNQLDAFIARGLQLLDGGLIAGLGLLLRLDHLQASERVDVLGRATWEVRCNWRPVWIAGSNGNPRWSSHWIVWLPRDVPRRPPLYLRQADLVQPRLFAGGVSDDRAEQQFPSPAEWRRTSQ
jgi:hypothetical protein